MRPIFLKEIPEGRILLVPKIADPVVAERYPNCNFCLGSIEGERPLSFARKEELCAEIPCARHGFRIGIFEHEMEEYKARAIVAKINRAQLVGADHVGD
jgi:hypothetical protein